MSDRCPHTDLTIPECSCRVCVERLIRENAPAAIHDRPPDPALPLERAPAQTFVAR